MPDRHDISLQDRSLTDADSADSPRASRARAGSDSADSTRPSPTCTHCGLPCDDTDIQRGELHFCCAGCEAVYDLLHQNELCAYYDLEASPGSSMRGEDGRSPDIKWGFLDHNDVKSKLIEFSDGGRSKATFTIPHMHCASCIYLLENLHRLHDGIIQARVTFLKKTATITWDDERINLRGVVELLAKIGYEPRIRLEDLNRKEVTRSTKRLTMQLGVAGFAFGNIMLISFPEYLSSRGGVEPELKYVFGLVSLALALPVVFFSASGYLSRAWKGLRAKTVGLDVPISLGILALFSRSAYEVISGVGPGYFDSLAGLVFLLLVGRVFQEKTYAAMSFERDYSSYFPLAVTRVSRERAGDNPPLGPELSARGERRSSTIGDSAAESRGHAADGSASTNARPREESVPVTALAPGDHILIRGGELIPADAVLFDGEGAVDYSFVTGESDPVPKRSGDLIYAGGRQTGGLIELEVMEEVSRSYLVRLWNQDATGSTRGSRFSSYAERISGWFTGIVLAIATVAGLFWLPAGMGVAVQVFTAVLIVACPCALALATPFTLGTATRLLGRASLFLKRADVVETLARTDHLVFDKTGTLTPAGGGVAVYEGLPLNDDTRAALRALARQSTHPVSVKVFAALADADDCRLHAVREHPGKGMEARHGERPIRLGSRAWLEESGGENAYLEEFVRNGASDAAEPGRALNVPTHEAWVEVDGHVLGRFTVHSRFRAGIDSLLGRLGRRDDLQLSLLSGDTDRERALLAGLFPPSAELRFGQSPAAKRQRIHELRDRGDTVLMVGDGLNDAAALDSADVGLVVSEDVTGFSPACDALLDDSALPRLDRFLVFSRLSLRVIVMAFVISFAYNIIGLSFAVAGMLSPLVSAVVMPVSSISVVLFTTGMVHLLAKRTGIR